MAMERRKCGECGKTCWHNSLGKKKDEAGGGWRCTYCGHPLGTGPKRDKSKNLHEQQVAKARRSA